MTIENPVLSVTIMGLNYSPEHTGIAPYTSRFAAALAAASDEVKVIAGYPHYPQWSVQSGYGGLSMRETIDDVPVRRFRHPVPQHPRTLNRAAMEVIFGLRSAFSSWGRPEVVLLVTPALFSTAILAVAAKCRKVPTVIWVQDIYSLGVTQTGATGRRTARIIRWVETAALSSGTTIVVIHDRFKRYLVQELGLDPANVVVVRNWAHTDFPRAQDVGTRASIRRVHGWDDTSIIVLHAGNMGAKQGLDNVVQASKLAYQENSKVRFVLLGDGNQSERLKALGVNDNLQFIAPLPAGEFESTLAAADILLVNELPGLTEMSVPSKLTTYFASGLPVIAATDESSTTAEEIMISGGGIRVDPDSPESLLKAAESLYADSDRAALLGQSGRQFAKEMLSSDSAVALLRRVLKSAMGSG